MNDDDEHPGTHLHLEDHPANPLAQVWRNEDDSRRTIWLSWAHGYGSPMRPAAAITERIAADREVVEAGVDTFDINDWTATRPATASGQPSTVNVP